MGALDGDQRCVTKMKQAYHARSDYVVAALNEIPGFECRRGEGAFDAFARLTGALRSKGLANDAELVELLINDADAVTVPGSAFGTPGYIRISFACSMPELEAAIQRIRDIFG